MKPGFSWLDLKLGVRMLVKYPGLTLVGALSMAFAVAVGAMAFEWLGQLTRPRLPLDDGDRIVGVRLWDASTSMQEERALFDFVRWRGEVRTVEELGAFRTVARNLAVGEGRAEPVELAEMTASGFRVARVPPRLGRALVDGDEQPGAPPVAVLGHHLWRTRFGADPGIVGREIRLGNTVHTVVGVMPAGFAFPVSHNLWVPLRPAARDHGRREGPAVRMFGRLAPGADLAAARAELVTLGRRAAADFPDTHRHLRPEVMPYASSILDITGSASLGLMSINGVFVLLVVLICANVALLVFVRAAARENEITVRTALGASRGRIVGQFFAEALVLGAVGAALGLAATAVGLRWAFRTFEEMEGRLPFWFSPTLSPTTVLYAVLLTAVGALVIGVLPALRLTRGGLGARLREAAAGLSAPRTGRLWAAVIVFQVAVTAVAIPVTSAFCVEALRRQSADAGFPAGEYLSVLLEMEEAPAGAPADSSRATALARYRATWEELERRLEAEPGVTAVTVADHLPRMAHPQRAVEVDGPAATPASAAGHRVGSAAVAPDFFETLGARPVAGPGFQPGDAAAGRRVVVVNPPFVERVLGGRSPIGRRIRYAVPAGEAPGEWHEIVGVVPSLGMVAGDSRDGAGVYHPLAAEPAYPVRMAVRVGADPQAFAPRLREVAERVDPALRLEEIVPLDQAGRDLVMEVAIAAAVAGGVGAFALFLSLTGIYSVLSFSVARRTREIGIRSALGAGRRRIVAPIVSRVLAQIGAGITLGAVVFFLLGGGGLPLGVWLILGSAALTTAVCLLACLVPIRRALRVEPTEALRAGT